MPVAPKPYIAEVRISPGVAAKIKAKHNLTPDVVRSALVLCTLKRSGWDWHPERGRRLIVIGWDESYNDIRAVLYPVDQRDGIWRLGTAMYPDA